MDKGTELYQKLIDELVEMSQSCVSSDRVRKGDVVCGETKSGMNSILAKLTQSDRDILADYVLKTYS